MERDFPQPNFEIKNNNINEKIHTLKKSNKEKFVNNEELNKVEVAKNINNNHCEYIIGKNIDLKSNSKLT